MAKPVKKDENENQGSATDTEGSEGSENSTDGNSGDDAGTGATDAQNQVDKKVEAAQKKGVAKGKAVNVIGEIEEPTDYEDKEEVKNYLKRIDKKLDTLTKAGSKKEETTGQTAAQSGGKDEAHAGAAQAAGAKKAAEKAPWYDRPLY